MSLLTAEYLLDIHENVWHPRDAGSAFVYTDGEEVEARLLEVVRATKDRSSLSLELAARITDWPSRYHLSPMRANLLRPITPLLRGTTLELGAGCGALSRFLGELGGVVVAVEGSPARAKVAAERCRDLANVSVVCERIEDFDCRAQFDAIVLVGVLEYARVYGKGADPIRDLLDICARNLAPHGSLIVAIENQLGLKYFAGAAEDHALLPMHGINDTYDPKSVVTFGRHELEMLLSASGFHDLQVLLPLPDYKLPLSIVFPRACTGKDECFNLSTFLANTTFADAQKPKTPLFSLERAWPVVARNRLATDLANSFLVVARRAPSALPICHEFGDILVKHYNVLRRPEFCKETTILAKNGGLFVTKEPLTAVRPSAAPISVFWEEGEYVAGELWSDRLASILNRPGWTPSDVARWAKPWLDELRNKSSGEGISSLLPNNFLDAVPYNLIRDEAGTFRFVDLEWVTNAKPELGYIVFRGLYWAIVRITSVAAPEAPQQARLLLLIKTVIHQSGFWMADSDIRRYVELENETRGWVTGVLTNSTYEELAAAVLNVRRNVDDFMEGAEPISRLQAELADAALREQEHAAQSVSLDERAKALELELTDCSAALESLRLQERASTAQSTALLHSVRTLEAELARRSAALEAFRLSEQESEERASALGAQVRSLEGELSARSAEWEALRRQERESAAAAASITERVQALEAERASWSTAMESLRLREQGSASRVASLSGRVNVLETELARASAATRELEQREDERKASLAAMSAKCNDLETQLLSRAQEVAALRTQAQAQSKFAAALSADNEKIRRSISWKLAAPLRWLGAMLLYLHSAILRACHATTLYRWTGKLIARLVTTTYLPGGTLLLPPNPLFEEDYYSETYPDTANARNLWAHYLAFGADEGRNPHPLFHTDYYRSRYPDVTRSGLNPLVHYYLHGASEGRNPCAGFDTSFYLATYPDVRQSGQHPLLHYWRHGRSEGRLARVQSVRYSAPQASTGSLEPTLAPVKGKSEPGPVVAVVMPTYNTPPRLLGMAIESVLRQKYSNWRLFIHDDGSTSPETIRELQRYAQRDQRISVQFGPVNQGISQATNAALALASGEYVAMLDHDDELTEDALLLVARALMEDPGIDVLYTDQAYIGPEDGPPEPLLKPDWSPELFRGVMFVGHLLVVRLDLARKIGGFDREFDRVQDFEFMLRLSEETTKIRHLPKVLYYWRRVPGSVAFHGNEKGAIEPVQAAAVNRHLARLGLPAAAAPNPSLAHRLVINPAPRKSYPKVKILVGSQTPRQGWVQSLLEASTYRNVAVFIPPDLRPADDQLNGIAQVSDRRSFHAALHPGDYVIWMDGNLEIVTSDWIEHLLFYCEQAGVASCSPLIADERNLVVSAGLVLGMDGVSASPMQGWPVGSDGYAGSLSCAREVSANSGECMMMSADTFRSAGGAVSYYATTLFEGADLSLRAFTMKRRNIVTPRAVVRRDRQHGSNSSTELDRQLFNDRWERLIEAGDPYYNPAFGLSPPGYSLAADFTLADRGDV